MLYSGPIPEIRFNGQTLRQFLKYALNRMSTSVYYVLFFLKTQHIIDNMTDKGINGNFDVNYSNNQMTQYRI